MKRFSTALLFCSVLAMPALAQVPQDASSQVMQTQTVPTMPMPSTVAAPAATTLTNQSIRQFYQASADSYKLPYDKFLAFTQSALAEQFQVTSVTTITIPNQPQKQANTTQTRAEAIAQLRQTYDGMKNATVQVDVDQLQVAPSGLSATAHSTTTAHNIAFPGQTHITGDTTMSCDDQIVLAPSGTIQILRSQCTQSLTLHTGGESAGLGQ